MIIVLDLSICKEGKINIIINNKGNIFINSTPQLYEKWLSSAIEYARNNDKLISPIVFINAWNEWGEGTYLEPDKEYGYAYLEATFEANCGE